METIQQGLANLRKCVKVAGIPASTAKNFRLLTWNIRNLNGNKEERAIKYYAEIIKNFDVIAIQECKDNLGGLEMLQKELGKKFKFLFSDGSGNSERLVFVYNSEKVEFTGLAAEIVMRPGQGRKGVKPELEFDRSPYIGSFRVKGCNFVVVTVHIYYGTGSQVEYRLAEIASLSKHLKKASASVNALDTDYIACGDFNIEDVREEIIQRNKTKVDPLKDLFKALLSGGLFVPEDIRNSPSNLAKNKHYDQIAYHRYKDSTIEFVKGGVIDFVGSVYIDDPKLKFKMTDHLPMWAVFNTSPDEKPKYINP